jgi:hypothetical protein
MSFDSELLSSDMQVYEITIPPCKQGLISVPKRPVPICTVVNVVLATALS